MKTIILLQRIGFCTLAYFMIGCAWTAETATDRAISGAVAGLWIIYAIRPPYPFPSRK